MSEPASSFTKKLIKWHATVKRDMPWKETRDPYKIWLSEIILQQTRVEQGKPYYRKMVKSFPTVQDLASASSDEVMRAWQGLGYYSRARNLHEAARKIVSDWKGKFPSTYEELLKLKGVGPYTAAAIASFAFYLPHAVVDGNVYRVLSRVFGIRDDINSSTAKKKFAQLAHEILDKKNPAAYNQAIMDFGALICVPANPKCEDCFYKGLCYAFQHKMVQRLPRNDKAQKIRMRWFTFLVLELGNKVIIEKRTANDIWKGLYHFPVLETSAHQSRKEILSQISQQKIAGKKDINMVDISSPVIHKLSHQTIVAQFARGEIKSKRLKMMKGRKLVVRKDLNKYGFPKLISNYLKKYLH